MALERGRFCWALFNGSRCEIGWLFRCAFTGVNKRGILYAAWAMLQGSADFSGIIAELARCGLLPRKVLTYQCGFEAEAHDRWGGAVRGEFCEVCISLGLSAHRAADFVGVGCDGVWT